MATVTKWTPFGVALDITATGSTVTRKSATQYTVKINASWETYYNGAETNYGMTASAGGSSATINKFGTYASSGSGSFTGTFSISGNGSATKTITVTFKNFNSDNGDSATKTVSFNVTVPAWTSYTVKYNANGGSGAPAGQTKWKDQTLTLSSTKPTRTGYSFLGWATSSTATSAAYSAGAKYTANAAATLYAVWKANTYTVSYNANGGSGAPPSQTKTYGKTLTLSSTKPTRANYTFKGWATSASATTATYQAGGSYTANAAATLYAVWVLAYKPPEISEVVVERDNIYTTATGETTDAIVSFSWKCDLAVSSIKIKWKLASSTSYATSDCVKVAATGTSGTVTQRIGMAIFVDAYGNETDGGLLAADKTYDVHIEVTDSNDSTPIVRTLAGSNYYIDLKPPATADESGGIAFGKPAELVGVADFGYKVKASGGFINQFLPADTNLNEITAPNIYFGENVASNNYGNCPLSSGSFTLEVRSAGNIGQLQQIITACIKTNPIKYERFYYSSAWGEWLPIITYKKLNAIFSTAYGLTTTVTKGENYSSASGNATLVGNNLRCYFSATRSSASTEGNITNEIVCTFKIAHGGKITGAYSVAIPNGATGPAASFIISDQAVDSTYVTFTVNMAATAHALTQTSTYFSVPVRLNIDAY